MTDKPVEATAQRSCLASSLKADRDQETLTLTGWVHRRRDLGGLVFIDLRDRGGLLQISFGPDWSESGAFETAGRLGHEDVISVEGTVHLRPEGQRNPDMRTGEVELRASRVEVLNSAATPVIPVYRTPEEELPSEELRLRHRVLDLRRFELQRSLALRHKMTMVCRNYLDGLGFVEVETPILSKPTPEGARDYLVPSREHPGEFYALPQSPQIYKQILMAAGFDRYFQIARCFRDEDLRADRQPEFTQIDVEASFVGEDDILCWIEGLMVVMAEVAEVPARAPFPRMSYAQALERFGVDRPDTRFGLEIRDFSEQLRGTDFRVIQGALEAGGRVRGFILPGGATLSRREIEALEDRAKETGAPGLLWVKRSADGGSGPLSRFLDEERYEAIGMRDGDLALMAAGPDRVTSPALSVVRVPAAIAMGEEPDEGQGWLWVTDFPVFEEDGEGGLFPNHHPFVMPHLEDQGKLESDPTSVRGQAYDLVFNGLELGSGSIRIHDPELQRTVFRILGLSDEEIDHKFGFLLEALSSGAPPHGGIALGLDRLAMCFSASSSLRDVVAFPKTTAARALFEGAPVAVSDSELEPLGIRKVGDCTEGSG